MIVTLLMMIGGDFACLVSREMRVETGAGQHIAAVIEHSRESAPENPVVVLIAGAGPDDRFYWIPSGDLLSPAYETLARQLIGDGYTVVRFDERGVGRSSGSYRQSATTETLAADVRALVRHVRRETKDTNRPIILAGHSEGAVIAALVAAGSEEVAAVVLLSAPAVTGADVIAYQQRYRMADASQWPSHYTMRQRDSVLVTEDLHRRETEGWYRFFLSYDPMSAYRSLRQPVLLLHGERDWQVPVDQARAIADTLRARGSNDVTLAVIRNADHVFREETRERAFGMGVPEQLSRWMGSRFVVRQPVQCNTDRREQ